MGWFVPSEVELICICFLDFGDCGGIHQHGAVLASQYHKPVGSNLGSNPVRAMVGGGWVGKFRFLNSHQSHLENKYL